MASLEFTYFDQFNDVDLSLTDYFDSINKNSPYIYSFTNTQSVNFQLKNIFDKINIITEYKKNFLFFTTHEIKDGDTITTLAKTYYSNQNYWWIICIFNNIKDIYSDWVLSEEQLQTKADILANTENKYTRKIYYEYLFQENEKKRILMILKPEYLHTVINKFRDELNG